MADITSRIANATVTLTLHAATLVDILDQHRPDIRVDEDEGGIFFTCSCGWDEDAEVIHTTAGFIRDLARMLDAEDTLPADMPDDVPVPVPSPNPYTSHVLDMVINGTSTTPDFNYPVSGLVQ